MTFKFNKLQYSYPRDKDSFGKEIDKYSFNMAKKIVSTRHLPFEFADELHGNFNLLFFEKVLPKVKNIKCDVATYFTACCNNYVSAILKSNVKKRNIGLSDFDVDLKWCCKYSIFTTGEIQDNEDSI